MDDLIGAIKEFFEKYESVIVNKETPKDDMNYKIYNEFSLQHELGTFLRLRLNKEQLEKPNDIFEKDLENDSKLKYQVFFEKNVKYLNGDKSIDWVKKEIDIIIQNGKDNYAIELKFPLNGQYPETMFQCVKDIQFMEQVKKHLDFKATYCVTLVNDPKYCSAENSSIEGIYQYFRAKNNIPLPQLPKEIHAPVAKSGKKADERKSVKLEGKYTIEWNDLKDSIKYYVIKINKIER